MCRQHTYNWQKLGVEEELGVSHSHGHDQLLMVSSLISWNFWSANEHAALEQAVHVHWQHLHRVWKDELRGREDMLFSVSCAGEQQLGFQTYNCLIIFFDLKKKVGGENKV